MKSAQLIVCERVATWAPALRTAAAHRGPEGVAAAIRETRSVADCERMLTEWPGSLVLIEAAPVNLAGILSWLAVMNHRWPLARAAAAVDERLAAHRDVLREAGAVDVVWSIFELGSILRLADRQLARAPERAEQPTESIWARLPWGE